MKTYHIYAAIGVMALSACGGSGDSDLGLPVEPFTLDPIGEFEPPAGPQGYIDLTNELVTVYEGLPALRVTDMPNAGVASFTGVALVDRDYLNGGYIGDFTATVSFGAQEFSGEATEFFYDPNEDDAVPGIGDPAAGSLTFVETGTGDFFFEVAAAGTLDGTTVNAAGEVLFLGTSAEGMLGSLIGQSINPDDTLIAIVADR